MDNRIISIDQSVFTAGDGTVNQLVIIHDDICKTLDDGNNVYMVFFDISKAFDRVWHEGLMHKLKCIGICGCLLDWFISSQLNDKGKKLFFLKCKSRCSPGISVRTNFISDIY